jgi:hypothetical protein
MHRKIIFIASLILFVVSVPIFVFYAMGYRFDFASDDTSIKKVGGLYVSSEVSDIGIYINDEPVADMRTFQNASYIQNLEAGMYQVHTQSDGLQTWVKNLPVFAHFVTETETFNIPQVPQIRLVTKYQTDTAVSVLFENATSTTFAFASTTNIFFQAATTATTSYQINDEYVQIQQLVASSTEEKKELVAIQEEKDRRSEPFSFDIPIQGSLVATSSQERSTSTKQRDDVRLFESQGDVYAQWVGKSNSIPFYYCVASSDVPSTAMYYGEHVYASFVGEYGTTTDSFLQAEVVAGRYCRSTIKIDRLWQSVQWFNFVPGTNDQVLMHLQDGVYVVEVDDRSWQNAQLLYPGHHLEVIVSGDRIYVKDDEYYLEIFIELQ